MRNYTLKTYQVDCEVEDIYEEIAEKFIRDNDGVYVPRLIKYMISLDEAKVCNELPGDAEEIAAKLNWCVEKVKQLIESATLGGAVQYNKANGKAVFANSLVNLADYGMLNPEIVKSRGPGFTKLMREIRSSEEYLVDFGIDVNSEAAKELEGPTFRILPRWKSIKNIPGVMPCENLYEILNENEGRISSSRCPCRTAADNRNCCTEESVKSEENYCMKLGEIAEYTVEVMKLGRYLSADEAMTNLEKTENLPMYNIIGNSREVRGGFCTCCSCCCDMRMGGDVMWDLKQLIMPSRFLCDLHADQCIGCGICIGKCPFFAIRLDTDTGKASIDVDKCMGCGTCTLNCPQDALEMKLNKPASFIPESGPQHIVDTLHLEQ